MFFEICSSYEAAHVGASTLRPSLFNSLQQLPITTKPWTKLPPLFPQRTAIGCLIYLCLIRIGAFQDGSEGIPYRRCAPSCAEGLEFSVRTLIPALIFKTFFLCTQHLSATPPTFLLPVSIQPVTLGFIISMCH